MFVIVSRYLIPKGFGGLTVFPFIVFRRKEQASDAVYVNHEKIHIRQQMELLVLPFFVWYFLEYAVRLIRHRDKNTAYKNTSFEREAYENEKSPDYLKSRPFWNFLKYL
jgi:uncharacterized ion transporter superfamily protein YfcC